MPYSLSYDRDMDCIVLVFEKTVNIDLVQKVAPQVARLCEETGCHRILNDMSAATIVMSLIEVFGSPRIMDASGVPRTTKRALVLPSNFPESHFLETVTRNRGHNLRVFCDIKVAKAWLLGDTEVSRESQRPG
jgi:hypothetical protein